MSRFGKEVKKVFARPAKAPDYVTKNKGCMRGDGHPILDLHVFT